MTVDVLRSWYSISLLVATGEEVEITGGEAGDPESVAFDGVDGSFKSKSSLVTTREGDTRTFM